MKYHRFNPYLEDKEAAFRERVEWHNKMQKQIQKKAMLGSRGYSIKATQSRCKVKPVTLPKLKAFE